MDSVNNSDEFSTSAAAAALGEVGEKYVNDEVDDKRIPIVYTTKLDDMKTFMKNMKDMDVDTIFNSIIKESYPKRVILKRKLDPDDSDEELGPYVRFKAVTRQIKAINIRIAKERKLKNLINIKRKHISKQAKVQDTSGRMSSNNTYTNRVLFNVRNKRTDVYSTDKQGYLTGYTSYTLNETNKTICLFSSDNETLVLFNKFCCWYTREHWMSILPPHPVETVRFMRETHQCSNIICRCCCKPSRSVLLSQDTIIKTDKILDKPCAWLKNLTLKQDPDKFSPMARINLIQKCLAFTPNKSQSQNNLGCKRIRLLQKTNLQFNNEFYEIGFDGQIDLFLKGTVNSKASMFHRYTSLKNNKIATDICCWYKREQVAESLFKSGTPQATVNYIRNTHRCIEGNCCCCCKPIISEKIRLTLFPISARYTNDLTYKRLDVNVKLVPASPTSEVLERKAFEKYKDEAIFYLPLRKHISALSSSEAIHVNEVNLLHDPQAIINILRKFSDIKFIVKGTLHRNEVFAEVDLHSLSRTELVVLRYTLSLIKTELSEINCRAKSSRKTVVSSDSDKKSPNHHQTIKFTEANQKKLKDTTSYYCGLTRVADLKSKGYILSYIGYVNQNFPELTKIKNTKDKNIKDESQSNSNSLVSPNVTLNDGNSPQKQINT